MFKKNMVDETYMPVYIDASIRIRKCHAMGVDTQNTCGLLYVLYLLQNSTLTSNDMFFLYAHLHNDVPFCVRMYVCMICFTMYI